MEFSQTLDLGNSTLANISKEKEIMLETPEEHFKPPKSLEVIDESPTNSKMNKTVSKSAKYRAKVSQVHSKRNGSLKKSKSDSLLRGESSENYSDFFKSDFSCGDFSSGHIITSSRRNSTETAKRKRRSSLNDRNLEDLFDDSGAFSEMLNNEQQVIEEGPDKILCNGDLKSTEFCSITTDDVGNDLWGMSSQFDNFEFSKEDDFKADALDSVINIENTSFVCLEENIVIEEKDFLKNELDASKHEVSRILKEEIDSPQVTPAAIQPKPSTSRNSFNTDLTNQSCEFDFSTCNKTLLNWSTSTNESPLPKKYEANAFQCQITKNIEQLKNISAWDLPPSILKEYDKKGIINMFDWQVECLCNPKVLFEHKNLVYSAPTSAGKTLVSELLVIKTVLERMKKALIILPFISVVREKMYYLQDLLTSSGYRVEGFFGGYSPPGGFESINVAICTIEKANSIVNKLLEQGKLNELGAVVIDEVHLISDPGRGYILELLLAKMLYISRKHSLQIQIITMSATLSNAQLLQKWLDAELYVTDFRPVELREMIKIGSKIYDNKMTLVRELEVDCYKIPNDQDNVAQLCIETILEECSVIVFCPSKDWCETLCVHLASSIYSVGKSGSDIGEKLRKNIKKKDLEEIKLELKDSPIGLDSVLEKTISFACAFHHAGLTTEERDIIETSFKSGILKIIVATSTLSSGVNLPARRVIIRSPMFGGKPMNSLTYKQMIGRAGRTGKDTLGESILICTEQNARSGRELISADLKPLFSCLNLDKSIHLKRALLEVISSGVASTKIDLENFINCTLLSVQKENLDTNSESTGSEETADDPIKDSINFLLEYEFIRLQKNDETNEDNYIATRLGMACLASSMPPGDGLILFSELQKSRKCFVLESDLHAVYLVTPYSVCYQIHELDWLDFLDIWEKLSPAMKRVGELVGVKESFIVRAMRGQSKLDYKLMQIHKRFYTALALQELVNEVPINQVAGKFKCSRGLLQSLQQMSSTFAGIVTSFCNSLNWTMLGLIVSQFKERLYFGVHRDLIDLMRIPDLNSIRARALFNSGIKSLVDLANSDVLTVEKILYNCISFDSAKKNDDENDDETAKRNSMRNLFVTGKTGVTVQDAAKVLISDARKFLQYEIGVKNINWDQSRTGEDATTNSESTQSNTSHTQNKRKSEERLKENIRNASPKMKRAEDMKDIACKVNNHENEHQQSKEKNVNSADMMTNINNPNINRNNTNVSDLKSIGDPKISQSNLTGKGESLEKITDRQKIDKSFQLKNENTRRNTKNTKVGCRRSPRNISKQQSSIVVNTCKIEKRSPNKENIPSNPILNDSNNIVNLDDSSFDINTQLLKESDNKFQNKSNGGSKNAKVDKPTSLNPKANKSIEEINTSQLSDKLSKTQSSRVLRSKRFQKCNDKLNGKQSDARSTSSMTNCLSKNEESVSLEISDLSYGSSLLRNPIQLNSSHILNTSKVETESASFDCLHIIDICGNLDLYKNAIEDIKNSKCISFSIGVEKLLDRRRPVIGANLLINQQNCNENEKFDFVFDECNYIAGISIALADNVVLYMNMQSENCVSDITKELRIKTVMSILASKEKILKMFDAKEQLKVLKKSIPSISDINAMIEDPKVASWLLQPDAEINFSHLARQYAPECTALVNLINRGRTSFSIGLSSNSSIKGKIRSAVESCVTLHILKGQLENLERISSGQLKKFFHELEMPIQVSLFRMESLGFAANESALGTLSQNMFEGMKKIESKIYELHGSRFNLSSSSAVARVLGLHKKSNGRYCTSKQILEKIDSPIADLILNYRKLSVTLSKNIQPLLKCVANNRIHGNSITFSSTGRISMHEPNLQNVAKDFEINVPGLEKILISSRSPFYPGEGKCLISADFCQLEMRVLTHLSQDPILLKVMNSEKDVFTSIAAQWNKTSENEVSEVLRNGTKQICYGIIYGMGMKSLADALKCTEQEAMTISEQFHLAYPGIRTYTRKVIRYAQQKGYVETITGRRRYLDHINSPEVSLRSQAERQAVNSTIQGSAADIAKNAILRMEKNLSKYSNQLKINLHNGKQSEVNFVLHLHDELIFEVPEDKATKIAKALKTTMENCVKLNVPLRVKLKIGKSWGTLQEVKI